MSQIVARMDWETTNIEQNLVACDGLSSKDGHGIKRKVWKKFGKFACSK